MHQTLLGFPRPVETAQRSDDTIATRFERQAAATPDNLAVVTDEASHTYRELDAMAANVAAHIVAASSLRERPIAVLMEKGPLAVVAMLGAAKAGRVFVPLELAAPEAWLTGVVAHSGAAQILTDRKWLDTARRIAGERTIVLDAEQFEDKPPFHSVPTAADSPACIIYTSGSTGRPKGVVQGHRGFLRGIELRGESLRVANGERFVHLRSMGYSAGIKDVFMVLFRGACLFPYDLRTRGLAQLSPWLNDKGITGFMSASSLFRTWLASLNDNDRFPMLRTISASSEPLYGEDILCAARHLTGDWRIAHSLSSTETGTIANLVYGPSSPVEQGIAPAGRVVRETDVRIEKENGTLARTGETGEIIVKSRFLALGYWNDPAATEAAFRTDPVDPTLRSFRSGDLGRWRGDGTLEYRGRNNRKIKLRGFSVEPYEIECALLAVPSVRDAALVVVGEGANARLVAYVVGPPDKSCGQVIRAAIAARLPSHMVPSQVVILDSLPLTPRGKLDRPALAALQSVKVSGASSRPPSNAVECALVQIWKKCLNLLEIGVDDDFYELGGTSLQAFLIFARIAQTQGRDLPPTTMLAAPTIAKQAALLQDEGSPRKTSKLIAFRDSGLGSPLFVIHAAFGDIGYARELARHLKSDRPVFGVRPPTLDGTEPIARTMEAIAADYIAEIRTVQRKGPYFLAGYSIGGRIAFEMAQQLVRRGETVAFLGLIDTFEKSSPKKRETVSPRASRHMKALRQRTLGEMANYIGMRAAKNLDYGLAVARLAVLEHLPRGIGLVLVKLPSYNLRPDLYRSIHRTASRRYTSQPYAGSITLFSAKGLTEFHRKYWQPLALGGLTVTEIPAGHTGMVWPPYSALLAEGFDACLESRAGVIAGPDPSSRGKNIPIALDVP
ncbi:MAG TPA: non-ribosomal peptide synthetase [Micropepsaceae bacterium]|nr:non-ribosomal peptide synthetase [Micropepsaceae bacterium]